ATLVTLLATHNAVAAALDGLVATHDAVPVAFDALAATLDALTATHHAPAATHDAVAASRDEVPAAARQRHLTAVHSLRRLCFPTGLLFDREDLSAETAGRETLGSGKAPSALPTPWSGTNGRQFNQTTSTPLLMHLQDRGRLAGGRFRRRDQLYARYCFSIRVR